MDRTAKLLPVLEKHPQASNALVVTGPLHYTQFKGGGGGGGGGGWGWGWGEGMEGISRSPLTCTVQAFVSSIR